jgi:hypothetical protein
MEPVHVVASGLGRQLAAARRRGGVLLSQDMSPLTHAQGRSARYWPILYVDLVLRAG